MGASLFYKVAIEAKSLKRKCQHVWELRGHSPKAEIKKF